MIDLGAQPLGKHDFSDKVRGKVLPRRGGGGCCGGEDDEGDEAMKRK